MRGRLPVLVAIFAVLMMVIPVAILSPIENAGAQDPNQPQFLNEMGLYMKGGMELSPLPPEAKDEWQAISIPNGFIKDGLFGHNLLPIGHLYWMDVGTWYTSPLRETVNLGGKAHVVIYATREKGSGNVNSDFIFNIMRGTEVLLALEVTNQRINEGVDNMIKVDGWFPSANDTTVEAGTAIALMIKARCQGGAIMKFGSTDVPSGFTFGSNSLSIQNIQMDDSSVKVEYKDAFMVPWIKLYTQLKINQIIQPNTEMGSEMNTENRTREIIWDMENTPGRYDVFISLSYDYSGDNNISDSRSLVVEKPHVSSFQAFKNFFNRWFLILVIIIIVTTLIVMYSKSSKRKWKRRFKELPPSIRALGEHRMKKEWKKIDKKRKADRRKSKKVEKERKDQDRGDRDFSLFRKKSPKTVSARREPRVAIKLNVEKSEELEL